MTRAKSRRRKAMARARAALPSPAHPEFTPADLAAAPNLATYLRLLDSYIDDDTEDDASLAALDSAWDALSSSERETARAISHNPTDLAAAVAHVRAMLAVPEPTP